MSYDEKMGGARGEIRDKSKIDTYLQYLELVEGWEDYDWNPDPKYKKACKSQMVQDPATGEWVLYYHMHT